MPETFRCPVCQDAFTPDAYSVHQSEVPQEREEVFALFVADEEAEPISAARCSGALEILPLMEVAERQRFGSEEETCGETVLACPCGGSHCSHHTFACVSCGRFTCLRHRWSAKCPACARGLQARPVRVEKYDPFSKQRSTFVRKYRRSGRPRPWPRLVAADTST